MRGIVRFSLLCGIFAGGCLSPTQFKLILETDAYCPGDLEPSRNVMEEVGITARQELPTDPEPDNRTKDCSNGGIKLPRTVGSLVLVPSDDVEVPIYAKMAMSVVAKSEARPPCLTYEPSSTDECFKQESGLENDEIVAAYKNLDANCCDGDDGTICGRSFACPEGSAEGCDPGLDIGLGDAGVLELSSCIVARRRMRFVPHTPLEAFIGFDAQCIGVTCKDDATCIRGECVSSELSCDDELGVCDLVDLPVGGSGGAGGEGAAGGTGGRSTGGAGGAGGAGGTGGFGPMCGDQMACVDNDPATCAPCEPGGVAFCNATGCCACTGTLNCDTPVCQTCTNGTACVEPVCDGCHCDEGRCDGHCQGMSFAGGSCLLDACVCDALPPCDDPPRPTCFQSSSCAQYCSQTSASTPICDPSPAANECCRCADPGVGGAGGNPSNGGGGAASSGGGGSSASNGGGGSAVNGSGGSLAGSGGTGPTSVGVGGGGGGQCGVCNPPWACMGSQCCMESGQGGISQQICM